MKCIPFLLLTVSALMADDFTTGQAARAMVGQPTFTTQSDQPSASVLGAMAGVAYDAATDTLFVADSNRVSALPSDHRVLLFKNISGTLPAPTADLPYLIKCPVCVGTASVVLGQPDFVSTAEPTPVISQSNLRTPTAVASDGVHLAVADTDHNRVLIWNSIPSSNNQPADVVVGQPNFTSAAVPGDTPNAQSMRGPQGVWFQAGKLYVADTQNHRILIFNHIPTTNGAAADLVLGQPNLTTFVQPDLTQQQSGALANNLLNPISVTSDGTRLFVTDLGHNRVLIWNTIPTTNQAPADVEIGQPDMVSSTPNYAFNVSTNAAGQTIESPELCTVSNGTDVNGNPTYPPQCNYTLNFPRFALSDGQRLFISDGGNDRVLVYEHIPTQNAAGADVVIGQLGGDINQAYDGVDSLRTPGALAWDGTNLYVADTFNRRINVYSIGANTIPYTGVRNAASLAIYAVGAVSITLNSGSSITAGNAVSLVIGNSTTNATTCTAPTATTTGTTSTNCGPAYTYEVQTNDTLDSIVTGLVNQINAGSGDPGVTATADFPNEEIILTAKQEGTNGNNVTISTTVSTNATVTATVSGATLSGGADAAQIGPGTIVSILGTNLSFNTVSADLTAPSLPNNLGGTKVFFNGIAAPLFYVSPNQVNAQIPWEVQDQTSINAYVRSVDSSGNTMVTTPVAVTIVTQNPGIFTQQVPATGNLKPGVVLHGSSYANGVVLIDGTATPNDVATITVGGRSYNYTVQAGDTLDTIRLALTRLLNQDPQVTATTSNTFARNVIIQARVPGPDGNNITLSSLTTHAGGSTSATLILTPTNSTLCCSNVKGSLVTNDNPAVPGETLLIYATGLGLPVLDADVQPFINTGVAYPANGPVTVPINFVSSLAGGSTANILRAGMEPGTVGVYEILLQLNSNMPTDPFTQLHIAQDIYLSNIVTFPLVSPVPYVPPTADCSQ
ncbi:MAG TPA: hypothetical protein VLY24_23000 [Bryobacteraceae bacterium]|nr:hypothetical protein [Bryobacteraceae bacterium]